MRPDELDLERACEYVWLVSSSEADAILNRRKKKKEGDQTGIEKRSEASKLSFLKAQEHNYSGITAAFLHVSLPVLENKKNKTENNQKK